MIDLEPIKARLKAAMPGPWYVGTYTTHKPDIDRGDWCGEIYAEAGKIYHGPFSFHAMPSEANAYLIAHSPTDMAALVSEVERLRMALDTVGATIYTQGRGTKMEQGVLAFIRTTLGRE